MLDVWCSKIFPLRLATIGHDYSGLPAVRFAVIDRFRGWLSLWCGTGGDRSIWPVRVLAAWDFMPAIKALFEKYLQSLH
jgi:hypothetical protein